MIEVLLPLSKERKLPFYLAMEEWVAVNLPPDDYFFAWIVNPTVIVGRNQDLEKEVNLDYCRENGIQFYRRRSGGGCVYADTHNIMLSFVTPSTDVTETFARFTARVAARLRAIGIDARPTGRNDIVVGDRKISGNAFYHLPGRSIVHGTMLFDTDVTHMLNAITPSRAKLESKQVKSVQSRIITASELIPGMTMGEFHARLTDGFSDSSLTLTDDQVAEIGQIERNYYRPEWTYGNRHRSDASGRVYERTRRFDSVGEITAAVALSPDGNISSLNLFGDYFMTADLDAAFIGRLIGTPPGRERILAALDGANIRGAVRGLDAHMIAELISDEQ